MARLLSVFLCVALIGIQNISGHFGEELKTDVHVVDSIQDFKNANPGLKLIPMERSVGLRGQRQYTFGRRVNGDRIVAQNNNNYNYPRLQDVRVQHNYPQSGTGNVVSYIQISVDQSSNVGQAYIVNGGIGYRYVSVVIEAKQVNFFRYSTLIFGY